MAVQSGRTAGVQDERCQCGLCTVENLDMGFSCHGGPCPICYDAPVHRVSYRAVRTHSWNNGERCDGHKICRPCLQRHVEVKLLDDGIWNIRCPGDGHGCKYLLVEKDVERALQDSKLREEALEAHKRLREFSGHTRLLEMFSKARARDGSWALRTCQACPNCLVLAFKANGCQHLACRCGTHFCFGCGADHAYGYGSCICSSFGEERGPVLGAWLAVYCWQWLFADESVDAFEIYDAHLPGFTESLLSDGVLAQRKAVWEVWSRRAVAESLAVPLWLAGLVPAPDSEPLSALPLRELNAESFAWDGEGGHDDDDDPYSDLEAQEEEKWFHTRRKSLSRQPRPRKERPECCAAAPLRDRPARRRGHEMEGARLRQRRDRRAARAAAMA